MPGLIDALRHALPPEVLGLATEDRQQWAGDASIYHLIPQAVVFPRHAEDLAAALAVARATHTPVCLRAGGTSLSGQAVTDGLLIVVSRHLRRIDVENAGQQVRCEPGAVGAWVNAALAPHGRKLGPDPASLQAAEIGGIVANNASGMCCGIDHNSYRTVTGLEVLLMDGTRLTTGVPTADAALRAVRPDLAHGLERLRDEVRGNTALVERIRMAFATKNTVGYSLNAFLDAETPAAILQKLVVGSEGTLAVILRATFATVPLAPHRSTAFLWFADVDAACAAVPDLAATGLAAIELLDAVSLRRVASKLTEALPDGEPAALLVEFHESDPFAIAERLAAIAPVLDRLTFARPATFTADPARQAAWWAIRKGLFPSVGAVRAAGTAVIIEDITFPVPRLAEGVRALRHLFTTHGYGDAVLFGHAKDGNLHFTLTPDLAQAAEVARYDTFMAALAELVLGFGGHLKAEHGTGRNMAPFVEAQWGADAVAIMRRIKTLLDPQGLLNPGVLLSDDPRAHLQHLKTLPAVDSGLDRCIECGFCEPICPSRDHQSSPRQRIALLRAQARGVTVRDLGPRVVDSCAGDSLCATACPVGIDTGEVMRQHRVRGRGAIARTVAHHTAHHLPVVTALTRTALRFAVVLPGRRLPGRSIPLPRAASGTLPTVTGQGDPWLYLPTCLGRTMGTLPEDLARLCRAAGIGLRLPDDATSLCCGQPFASKGFPEQAATLAAQWRAHLAMPGIAGVLTDTATCAAHTHDPRLYDPARFVAEVLLPRLAGRMQPVPNETRWLHPTCADQTQGWGQHLTAAAAPLGQTCTPASLGCCGMAGDKGWTLPGLATAAQARERADVGHLRGITTSPTCAAALGHEHLWTALAQRLEPKP